jgi:oxygen-independent coproporphyrinogen-3 oxidase
MLGVRLREGLALDALPARGREAAAQAATDGLLEPGPLRDGRAVLTLRGRLLADRVTLALAA